MNNHGARCKVTQFPLRPAFASTTHSLQGTTIRKGSNLVAHGYMKKGKVQKVPKCLYYVMMSRCASLDNIYLDKNFDIDQIQCSENALKAANILTERSINDEVNQQIYDIFFMNVRSFQKHEKDLLQDL